MRRSTDLLVDDIVVDIQREPEPEVAQRRQLLPHRRCWGPRRLTARDGFQLQQPQTSLNSRQCHLQRRHNNDWLPLRRGGDPLTYLVPVSPFQRLRTSSPAYRGLHSWTTNAAPRSEAVAASATNHDLSFSSLPRSSCSKDRRTGRVALLDTAEVPERQGRPSCTALELRHIQFSRLTHLLMCRRVRCSGTARGPLPPGIA